MASQVMHKYVTPFVSLAKRFIKRAKLLSDHESFLGGIAGRYASALFELMQELPEADQVALQDAVSGFRNLLNESEALRDLVASPIIEVAEKKAALGALFGRVEAPQIFQNFVSLVVGNGRAFALAAMCQQFMALVAQARNEMRAEIISVAPLEAEQTKALEQKLADAFGKAVIIDAKTDPDLLGGLIVKIGSRMVDGSLRTKLNSLQRAMNEAG